MLWQLLAKLMFRACVPLILLAGVLTYGHYLRGGDAGALWKGIAGRATEQVVSLFDGVRNDAARASGALSRSASNVTGNESGNGLTQVYMWKDSMGVTHYSSAEPAGVNARAVSVDPNVNVLAPVRAPAPAIQAVDAADSDSETEADTRMPGVAGQVLSTRHRAQGARASGTTSDASAADLDPMQLLRMIQAAER